MDNESIHLLNGINEKILQSIQDSERFSIFAYGSLLWKPCEYIDEIIPNCTLLNYIKGFFVKILFIVVQCHIQV